MTGASSPRSISATAAMSRSVDAANREKLVPRTQGRADQHHDPGHWLETSSSRAYHALSIVWSNGTCIFVSLAILAVDACGQAHEAVPLQCETSFAEAGLPTLAGADAGRIVEQPGSFLLPGE